MKKAISIITVLSLFILPLYFSFAYADEGSVNSADENSTTNSTVYFEENYALSENYDLKFENCKFILDMADDEEATVWIVLNNLKVDESAFTNEVIDATKAKLGYGAVDFSDLEMNPNERQVFLTEARKIANKKIDEWYENILIQLNIKPENIIGKYIEQTGTRYVVVKDTVGNIKEIAKSDYVVLLYSDPTTKPSTKPTTEITSYTQATEEPGGGPDAAHDAEPAGVVAPWWDILPCSTGAYNSQNLLVNEIIDNIKYLFKSKDVEKINNFKDGAKDEEVAGAHLSRNEEPQQSTKEVPNNNFSGTNSKDTKSVSNSDKKSGTKSSSKSAGTNQNSKTNPKTDVTSADAQPTNEIVQPIINQNQNTNAGSKSNATKGNSPETDAGSISVALVTAIIASGALLIISKSKKLKTK
jgi:hypothetical protein